MSDIPVFRPSFGNRPDQIVGRSAEVETIVDGLGSYPGSAERATFLVGQRGTGKTALLLEIAERARQLNYVVVRVTCGEAMLDNAIDSLSRAAAELSLTKDKSVRGFSAGAFGFSLDLTLDEEQRGVGFRSRLEAACKALGKAEKRVLVLVDEVDPSVGNLRTLATTYQELVGDGADIAIVMAGLPGAVSGTLNARTLTFLNRAQRIPLGPVAIHEVEAYYRSAFERSGLRANAETVRGAAALTEGYPYLLQLIGFHLVRYAGPDGGVGAEELALASQAALAEFDAKVLQAALSPLSDLDLAFLREMARDEGPTRTSDLEERLGLTHGTVQTYRRRLLDAGLIESPRRGTVSFALPQMAAYLEETRDGV